MTSYKGFEIEERISFGETVFAIFTRHGNGIGTAASVEAAKVLIDEYLSH